MQLLTQINKIWLSIPDTSLEMLPSSAYIRFSLITAVENVLQRGGYFCTTESAKSQELLTYIREFVQSIQTSQKVYKTSLSITLKNYSKIPDFIPHRKSNLALEELKTQLTIYRISNLKEIIVVRDGNIIPFLVFL